MIVQGKRDVLGSVEEVCEITSNHVVESAHLARIAPKGRCPAMGLEEVMILTDTVVPSGGHDVLDDVSLLSTSESEPSSPARRPRIEKVRSAENYLVLRG